MPARSLSRLVPGLLAAMLLLLLPSPAAAARSDCAGRDLAATAENRGAVRAALVCLHNEIRASNGLPLLKENSRLRRAAVGHSADMVAQSFFDHTGSSGATLSDRLTASGYIRPGRRWSAGENLALGTGALATPAGVIQAWMGSPGHRDNMLRRSFRDLGVGIQAGVPTGDPGGATFTADYGVRR